ncbi:MAG: hypothetical protein KGK10_02240 [Rhodospirillales bacterium]|nr:hypothetical protein [Rhodospirillales bacterium]
MSAFFASDDGLVPRTYWRRYDKLLRVADTAQEAVERLLGIRGRALRRARAMPPQRVLVAAVEVPGREADLARVIGRLGATHHALTVATQRMLPRGKMANINAAIAPFDLERFDWLLVIDDDIEVRAGFLDVLLAEAAYRGFRLAMPAHRQHSFATYRVTRRHWASASRRTGYVEIGPVTLLHRGVFGDLIPFPELRWAWGIDVAWANLAVRRGWPIGVVDVAPIRHLRPVAGGYRVDEATAEAEAFLEAAGADLPRAAILRSIARYR